MDSTVAAMLLDLLCTKFLTKEAVKFVLDVLEVDSIGSISVHCGRIFYSNLLYSWLNPPFPLLSDEYKREQIMSKKCELDIRILV